jgi:hypothetical protein
VYAVNVDTFGRALVTIKSKKPSRLDSLGEVTEYSLLEYPYGSSSPFVGEAHVSSTNYPLNATTNEHLTKIRSVWTFPTGLDIFQHAAC